MSDFSEAVSAIDRQDDSSPLFSPLSSTGVSLCRGCHTVGQCRLGLRREKLTAEGIVVSEVVCSGENEGGPNVAHGGWTAGILDELAGHALVMRDEFCVTGTLTVKFVRPVPLDVPLIGRAEITGRERRKVSVSATLELAQNGTVVAEAQAVMIRRSAEHFSRHEQWMGTQQVAFTPGERHVQRGPDG